MLCEVPCEQLVYNELASTYTVLKFPEDLSSTTVSTPTTLKFTAQDCDPTTGLPEGEQGYNDEYIVSTIISVHALLIFN